MSAPRLRPLDFGEILDVAFTLYRRHFGTFFVTALLPNLPIAAFWMYLGSVAGSGAGAAEEVSALAGVGALLMAPYSAIAAIVVWAALVHQTSRAMTGGRVDLGDGYRRALGRFFPLLGAGVVAMFLMALGFMLLFVPGVLIAIMFFAVVQAVVIEGEGPLSALGRSRDLARDGWARIFGVLFVTWLIVFLPTMAVFGGLGFLAAVVPGVAEGMMTGGGVNAGFQAASVVVGALTTPYMAASLVVLYYDRRVRKEGLDLELAAEQISPGG